MIRISEELPPMLSRVRMAGINPKILQNKKVAIFGVGGLGAVVSEMLARVGVGKLILVDKDIVLPENFNRLGFDVGDINKPKAQVISEKLLRLNNVRGEKFPLEVKWFFANVIGWDLLPEVIKSVDAVFTCFDNPSARLEVNYWAVKCRKPLIDGGTSENGLRGRIITVIPYKTPCLNCYFGRGTLMNTGIMLNLESCNASLPTTMAMIAALQVHQGIKLLLGENDLAPLILVSLENDDPKIIVRRDVKRRRDCEVCGNESEKE